MKKLIAAALLVAVLLVAGYFAYTNLLSPRPVEQASAAAQTDSGTPAAMPTIVTAALNKDGIPTQLSSLPLTGSEKGKQALDEFAKMHGEGFDLVDGYRADYSNDQGKATLYVGQAKSPDAATALASQMATKIGQNNAMFTDLQELNISGRTIYEVKGQGQLHFFYAVNDKLVWLATDSDFAADGLHSIWGAVK